MTRSFLLDDLQRALDRVFQDRPGEPLVLLPGGQVAEVEDLAGRLVGPDDHRQPVAAGRAVAHLLADLDRLGIDLGADARVAQPRGQPERDHRVGAREVGHEDRRWSSPSP